MAAIPDIRLDDPLVAGETGRIAGGFPVLTAVTDDPLLRSTVDVTDALATRRNAVPRLAYVMAVNLAVSPDATFGFMALADDLADPTTRARTEQDIRQAFHLDQGPPAAWPLEIELGDPVSCIAQRAQQMHAELIVMGLHAHRAMSRALGFDTLRGLVSLTNVPVLAVRPPLQSLPTSVVVAVDFSDASLRAARVARRIMDEHGTMFLVYVEPVEPQPLSEHDAGLRHVYSMGVDTAFTKFINALHPLPGMTIVPTVCRGSPVAELSEFCERVTPELFAIGSQRHSVVERLFLGSVARAMLQDAKWPALVCPPKDRQVPEFATVTPSDDSR